MLLAHYRLNGDATDSVGGNDGTATNVSWVGGKLGQAGDFTQGGIDSIKPVMRTYSISMWINLQSGYTGSYRQFLTQGDRSPGFWFRNNDNRLHLRLRMSDGSQIGPSATSISLRIQEWDHLVFVCETTTNGVKTRTYINGDLSDETMDEGSLEITGNQISLVSEDYFADDVRIYDHALSPREVRDLSLPLVLHLKGNDELNDRTGQVTTLTNMGSTFDYNTPVGDGSYLFDGVDDYISTGYNFPEMVGDISYALTAWIYLTDPVPESLLSGASIFGHASDGGFGLQISENKLNFGMRGNSNFHGDTTLETGKWYFCVGNKIKGDGAYIYLDATLDASADSSVNNISATSSEVQIGAAIGRLDRKFPGYITDVRVYNDHLTEQQIKELYEQRASIDSEGSFHTQHIEDFSFLEEFEVNPDQSDLWETFGLTHGSIDVSDGVCTITNETGGGTSDIIGIHTASFTLEVGGRLQVVSKGNSGRHATLFGFGTSPYDVFPHGGTGNTTGLTIYYRESSSTRPSYRDESNSTLFDENFPLSGEDYDFEQYNTFEVYRRDKNTVEIYVNDVLEAFYDDVLFENPYQLYFSADGHTTPCSVSIKEVVAKGVKFSVESTGTRFSNVSEVGPIDRAVGWWPLIKDKRDYVGNIDTNNTGAEPTGFGYEFNDNGHIEIPEINTPQRGSISAWATVDSVPDSWASIVSTRTSSDEGIWIFADNLSSLSYSVGFVDGDRVHSNLNPSNLDLTVPFLVTMTWNENQVKAYFDGVLIGTYNDVDGREIVDSGLLRIGGDDRYGFVGTIRDVRFYNRALSDEEVAILYEMTDPESNTKVKQTADTVYTKGQIIEV